MWIQPGSSVKVQRCWGTAVSKTLRDVVVVDSDLFERSHSQEAAQGITYFNGRLSENSTPYLLIGVGRWGSNDPWLGIPVHGIKSPEPG